MFDDMTENLEEMITLHANQGDDFTKDERNLISVGYKNYIGDFQIPLRIVNAISKTPKYQKYTDCIPKYKTKLALKVRDEAVEISNMFREKVYKVASDQEAMSSIQKYIGDYFRYAIEAIDMILEDKLKQLSEATGEKDIEKLQLMAMNTKADDGGETY